MLKTDQISDLLSRGVDEIIVRNQLEARLRSKDRITLFLGIDPTGFRLHLGHAIALRKLRDFQRLGHRVIFLIGNFTARIGDTSDKDSPRQPLSQEQIEENFKTYKQQASTILDFSKIELRYNADWLEKLTFKEIIELANKFTVQQMIEREMYTRRISEGRPIGLHEFLYPLMQGFDSVAMDVDLEVGGRDQLFNMLAGRTLQKAVRSKDKHVLTVKLLEGTDGRKMAKTYDNVINITDTPSEQYGRVMSIKDQLIVQYFELCTDVPMHEVGDIEQAIAGGENPRDLKMRLGREIVSMYHGKSEALEAEGDFIRVFREKSLPDQIPEKKLGKAQWSICELLVAVRLAPSKSEGRRLIEGGGVSVDGVRIEDPRASLTVGKKSQLIKVGKRHFVKVIKA